MKSIVIKTSRFADSYGALACKINADFCCGDTEDAITLPPAVGSGGMKRYFLAGGMEITLADFQLVRELTLELTSPAAVIELCFCLKGHFRCEFGGEQTELKAGQHQVRRYGSAPLRVIFPAGVRIVYAEVKTGSARLQPCPNRAEKQDGCRLADFMAVQEPCVINERVPSHLCAPEQMLDCPYSGYTRLLFLEAKALEWAAYCINRHFCGRSSKLERERRQA